MTSTTSLLVSNPANGSQWWSGPFLTSNVPAIIRQYAESGYVVKDAR